MTPAQEAAFLNANLGGSAFSHTDALFLFAAVATVLSLFWFIWVTYSAYQAWGTESISKEVAGSQVLRALFITVVTLTIVAF